MGFKKGRPFRFGDKKPKYKPQVRCYSLVQYLNELAEDEKRVKALNPSDWYDSNRVCIESIKRD